MENKFVLIGALLVFGTLLFGCSQPAQPQGGTPTVNGEQATQGAAAQNGGATSTPTVQATQGGASGGNSNDWQNKGYAQLVALGIPLQCDVKMTIAGASSTSKMFFSGGKVRTDTQIPIEGQTISSSTVIKDNKIYTSILSMQRIGEYADCDWLVFDATEGGQTGNQQQANYDSVPAADFSCSPWVPDESKFATAGKACDFHTTISNAMPSIPGDMPAGYEACSGLEGQALMDCIENVPQ